MFAAICAVVSGGKASIIGVENRPGAIAITRMPGLANSRAAGRHMAAMAPLDAA